MDWDGRTKTVRLSEQQAKKRAKGIWTHLSKIVKGNPVFYRQGFLLVFNHKTFSVVLPMSIMGLSEDNQQTQFTFDKDYFI
jgi:hypothetical protein